MFFQNVTSEALAKQALAVMLNTASKNRRQNMQKRLDYFNDIQLNYLDSLLAQQFAKYQSMKLQKEFFNLTKLVIDELSVIYNEEPDRTVNDAKEVDGERFAKIVEDSQLNLVMDTALRLAKLCKTVLVKPVWRSEKIEYDILTPNIFDVIQDPLDPTKAKGIIYAFQRDIANDTPTGNNSARSQDKMAVDDTIYYYWDAEKHFTFSYSFNEKKEILVDIVNNPDNPDNINPYGVLPFVVVRDGYPVDNFFIEGGDDLINVNEILNIKLTEKNYLTKMQSFSVPVRKGADSKTALILDPSMTVDLPADDDVSTGSDFRFVSPDAKISELENDIEARLRRIAIKYHLNPDMFVASGTRSSADSLQMQNYRLGLIIKRDKPIFRLAEIGLFELTKIINNYHSNEKIAESATLSIDYSDLEIPVTMAEQDQHLLLLSNNGLLTKKDWVKIVNKDIQDDKEAEAYLAEVEEEKQAAVKSMQETMKLSLGDNPEDSPEDNQKDKGALDNGDTSGDNESPDDAE